MNDDIKNTEKSGHRPDPAVSEFCFRLCVSAKLPVKAYFLKVSPIVSRTVLNVSTSFADIPPNIYSIKSVFMLFKILKSFLSLM